ncbi:MAG: hypothetical protein LBQ24_07835 [Candidatus Peribacteria bacterium]|nr:hypothetical protein [Candidatus Peribacteria bacterium]
MVIPKDVRDTMGIKQ